MAFDEYAAWTSALERLLRCCVMFARTVPPQAALAVAAFVVALAASPQEDPRREAVDRIVEESLARGEAYARLRSLCRIAPHRLSGSKGAEKAIRWARDIMERDGLENVRLEPCRVARWERGEVEELTLTSPPPLRGARLPILALGGSIATPEEGIEAGVIVVRSVEELRKRADEARGRIVLFNRPMDDANENPFQAYGGAVGQRRSGASEAARVGAVAALVRSLTTRLDDFPHTGAMQYAAGVPRIPAAAISTNGANRIAGLVEAGRDVRLRLRLDCRSHDPVESFNVVGELVGRELPDEIVVVGAHLDAWDVGEGAHDDGAGCVQALEVPRLLEKLGLRPRRTIRCVLFMNEENGVGGGNAYFRTHIDEMSRHVLAVESDRGGFTPRGFAVAGTDAARAEIAELVELLERTGVRDVDPGGGGADIGPMAQEGVPLVGFVPDPQRYFDYHHSARDVFAAVNRRELELGAAAIAGLVWLVADAEGTLPRAPIASSR